MRLLIFMLHFIFILLVVLACGQNEPEAQNGKEVEENVLLPTEGYVRSNGQGIAGVVVTDGKDLVQTDETGKFSLPYNSSATHVYISSPAGYTVPVEKSVPMFWINLKKVKDRKNIEFTLSKMNVPDNRHFFVAVGDPQVRNRKELDLLKPILSEMTANITGGGIDPVHLMVAGDIVFDTPEMHDASKEYFSAVKQPAYYAIGNHDHLKTASASVLNDKTSDSTYIRHYGPTYYSFNRGKVHYIVLDNILFEGGPDTKYSTYFTQEQLDWVKKDLSYVPKEKALVVMFHAPSMSRYQATYGNSADLHKLLDGYADVHLISGHTHYNSVMDNGNGIIEHNVGAVCGGFWEGPVCLDGTRLGYKVFEVNGTDIQWEYRDYMDPETPFSIFKPGEARAVLAPSSDELLVNVWDWDTEWKVTYSEDDGNTFKAMLRYDERNRVYDPVALEYFGIKGDNTVPGRTWVTANKTDHIFTVVPSKGVQKIHIQVESRFKTYIREIDLQL